MYTCTFLYSLNRMPTKDMKEKTTKRRSTVKSTENKRKVPRKSSTQLKKGGVIGRIYDPRENRYNVNNDYVPSLLKKNVVLENHNPKWVYDRNKNWYDIREQNNDRINDRNNDTYIDYSKPYMYKYTQPKLDIRSTADVPRDDDMKWKSKNDLYENNNQYDMKTRINFFEQNEYPREKLADVGRQNAMRYDDNYKILEKKEVPKKEIKGENIYDKVSFFNKLQNRGGRKVTKKQVVPKRKVTKKPADPNRKVTKKPTDPKKKVTKKPTDPKKKVTKK